MIDITIEQQTLHVEIGQPILLVELGGIGPPGPVGPTGGQTASYPAGQNIFTGRVVIVDGGKVYLFQPANMAHSGRAYGIALSSGVENESITIQTAGEISDASFSFTADTMLWAWADGEIKNDVQIGVPIIQKAGVATGNEKIKIDFSTQLIRL